MTEKSLDEKTIADKIFDLMRAPDPENFQEAMEVANPEGDHKKEVWANTPKQIKKISSEDLIGEEKEEDLQTESDDILAEIRKRRVATKTKKTKKTIISRNFSGSKAHVKIVDVEGKQEEWSEEAIEASDQAPEKYILIKGIPVPDDDEEHLWLKVTSGSDEFYFDKAMEESISVPFKVDRHRFPLQLEISIWHGDFAESKFKRIGIFPADPTVKRVATDLSSRGREVKGVTDGSQESIKKFAKELIKKKAEKKDTDWFGGSNISSHGHSLSVSCSGMMISSATMGSMPILQHNAQNTWAIEDTLKDDSELTENMEIQMEGKIKTAVNDLRDEIKNEMLGVLEETKRNLINDLQTGKIALPLMKDSMAPDYENISQQTQIYSQHDMEEILTEVIKSKKDKKNNVIPPIDPNECVNLENMGLRAMVSQTGVGEWEAEERIEKFFEKIIKGEENDHGDLD